ncbi:hypothetical protein ACQ86N_28820 [Puia sp. P3]|uniref:hypothetical protein n=1 Tax=Puia sp. P3 TaxID=3423952 RepID=UPI003D666875
MIDEQQLTTLFPSFEQPLVKQMAEKAEIREIPSGELLLKTGQNIRSTTIVTKGLVKIFREDEEGASSLCTIWDLARPAHCR